MKSKILTALLSAAIAIAIWTYVVTVVSPNSAADFRSIPVTVQSEGLLHERGLMITSIDTKDVSLRLEGTRIDLNKLSNTNIGITVDASRIDRAGVHNLTYNVAYPGEVPQNSINILSKSPDTVTVTVENRASKPVPVEVQYAGTVAENFVADKENKILDRSEINIAGPESVIEQIEKASIQVNLEGRNESINERYTIMLCNAAGEPVDAQLVTTDYAEVNLTLQIMRIKQVELTLKILEGGGATSQNTTITMEPRTIWISGSDTLLEGMDSLEVGVIDLSAIPEDTTLKLPIKLPEGITDESGISEVTADIQFRDLATKKLTITNIVATKVPAGRKAEVSTRSLTVDIRGPKDKLESLKADSLRVEVDFTDTELGFVKVKAVIVCDDPAFGAVGTYTVSANVSETNS